MKKIYIFGVAVIIIIGTSVVWDKSNRPVPNLMFEISQNEFGNFDGYVTN